MSCPNTEHSSVGLVAQAPSSSSSIHSVYSVLYIHALDFTEILIPFYKYAYMREQVKCDEETVFTGSSDGMIRIVQILPNRLLGVVGEHSDCPVERMTLSPDRK